jgi:hypothetical protein
MISVLPPALGLPFMAMAFMIFSFHLFSKDFIYLVPALKTFETQRRQDAKVLNSKTFFIFLCALCVLSGRRERAVQGFADDVVPEVWL